MLLFSALVLRISKRSKNYKKVCTQLFAIFCADFELPSEFGRSFYIFKQNLLVGVPMVQLYCTYLSYVLWALTFHKCSSR